MRYRKLVGETLGGAHKARLSFLIFASRILLFWEKALPYLLAPAALLGLFLILSWFGVFENLSPPVTRLFVLLLFLAGAASLIPLARQPYPEKKEAIARLDRGTPYRIVSTLSDRLGLKPSSDSAELWRLHQQRLAAMLHAVRIFRPRPELNRRDKYGLRFAFILCLCLAALVAGPERLAKLRQALASGSLNATPPRLDAWITPPAYTGRAPVFLNFGKKEMQAAPLSVPEGSLFALRTAGRQGVELRVDNAAVTEAHAEEGGKLVRFEHKIEKDIAFRIQHYGRPLAEGRVQVMPDLAPKIALAGPVQIMLGKSMRVRAKVEDDYGIVAAEARFTHGEEKSKADFRLNRSAPPQTLVEPPVFALTFGTSRPREAQANVIKDLSDHPYAGLPMMLTLHARDDAGHEAKSESVRLVLPARPFSKPLAAALVALRQTLALDKRKRGLVSGALDLILAEPEGHIETAAQHLQLSALRAQLLYADGDDALRAALERMWDVANFIENGNLSEAERALLEAQTALERALDSNASPEEIAKLMQNLRQAMANYLKEMQNQAARAKPGDKIPSNVKFLTENDLEQLLRRIEQLSRSGARDAARQQLQNLRDLLNALRNSDPGASGQASAMQKQLNDIAGMMREQQKLMDETFKERNRARQMQGDDRAQPNAPERNGSPALRGLEQRQGGLREKLQGLEGSLPEGGDKSKQAMKDATGAMGEAEAQLHNDAPGGALPEQGKALESMRKGAQALMKEMGGGETGESGAYGYNEDTGDPNGQPRYNPFSMGEDLAEGNRVPDEAERKTIQDILDEVKRRLSDPSRPKLERDYLERLLRPF